MCLWIANPQELVFGAFKLLIGICNSYAIKIKDLKSFLIDI